MKDEVNLSNVKQYSLYKTLTPTIARLYSLFKLGHVQSLNKVSRGMICLVLKTLSSSEREKMVIYGANKSPVDDSCKKSSLLLAENVANFFNVPLLIGEYSHIFSDMKYFNKKKVFRKTAIHFPLLKDKNQYKKYHIVIIDDSIVTGASLKDSLKELSKISDNISFFSVVKLDPDKKLELGLNDYIFESNSHNILSKIVMVKGYRFTTQMLRTINGLSPLDLRNFIKSIDPSQKKQLYKGYKNFYNCSLRVF